MMASRKFGFLAFILAALLFFGVFPAGAKTYLVAVGVADYPGTENDLSLPTTDAKDIVGLYSKNGNVEYKMLLDWQATVDNIVAVMDELFAKAGPDDTVVFYFGGHGAPGYFCAYDYWLEYERVREAMARSKSKHKIIFANACFSGDIRTSEKASSQSVADAKKADVLLFLSSRTDEYSYERDNMRNSFFVTCLLKGLKGAADANRDRTITARELYNYVHANVIKISDGEQHPVMWGRFPDNLPIMKW